jgi:hypothetical protein
VGDLQLLTAPLPRLRYPDLQPVARTVRSMSHSSARALTAWGLLLAVAGCAVNDAKDKPDVTPVPAGVAAAVTLLHTDPDAVAEGPSHTQLERWAHELPEGGTASALPGTWSPDGPDGGVITAVYKSGTEPARHYKLVMVNESGKWKVQSLLGG